MEAILKALSTVMNKNRKSKMLPIMKQLKCESAVKTLLIKLKYSCDLHFNVPFVSNVLHFERCWQTVDVTSKYFDLTEMFPRLAQSDCLEK